MRDFWVVFWHIINSLFLFLDRKFVSLLLFVGRLHHSHCALDAAFDLLEVRIEWFVVPNNFLVLWVLEFANAQLRCAVIQEGPTD